MIWKFFKNYLFSQRSGSLVRRISWLCIVGVAVGIFSFILILSIMNGLNLNIRNRILSMEPHLQIQILDTVNTKFMETHPAYMKLKSEPGNIALVYEQQDVILRTMEGHFRGAVARGLTEESLGFLVKEKIDFPQDGEIIIGSDLARILGIFEGDFITIIPPESLLLPPGEVPRFEKVSVKKIITTSLADLDAQNIFYLRGKALNQFSKAASRSVGIETWISNPDDVDQVKSQLQTFPMLKIQTWKEKNSALFFALKLEKTIIGLFLTLAGLVTSFSIVTVIALLISQKKREIGILAAMGLSVKKTCNLFTGIGLMLSLIGGGIGLVFGTALSLLVEFYPIDILPNIYYDNAIPAKVDFIFILITSIVSIIIAFLAAWIPSRSVSHLSPSVALRSKN
jgi:lipoprotein-releasing system permease protein